MFDPSAPHILILIAVVLLLFGSTRLPGAAKALGQSMRIFKKEVKGLGEDDQSQSAQVVTPGALPAGSPPQPGTPPAPDATQQQLADLQRQIADLQRQTSGSPGNGTPVSETRRSDQPH
jgi:sec-independent protein translocase protein TatA